MAFESKKVLQALYDYFDEQQKAETGEERRKWFMRKIDGGDPEKALRTVLETIDNDTLQAYQESGEDDAEYKDVMDQVHRRTELIFVQAFLSGYRRRYVAGENSDPVSELDSRRYAVYSSRFRKIMLDRLKDALDQPEDGEEPQ